MSETGYHHEQQHSSPGESNKKPGIWSRAKALGRQAKKGFKDAWKGSGHRDGADYTIAGAPKNTEASEKDAAEAAAKKASEASLNAAAKQQRAEEAGQPRASATEVNMTQGPNGTFVPKNTQPYKAMGNETGQDYVVLNSEYFPDPRNQRPLITSGENNLPVRAGRGEVVKYQPRRQGQSFPQRPGTREAQRFEEQKEHVEKVVFTDITAIVDRYARDISREKLREQINKSGFLKRAWFRLSESGYEKKFFDEAKAEILKNKNLMSEIEVRFARKSQSKALFTGDDQKHFAMLDKTIEAYMEDVVEKGEVKKTGHRDAAVDAAAAKLIVDLHTGKIKDRAQFETEVEEKIIKKHFGNELKGGKDRMYASSLWSLAEKYTQRFKDLVAEGKKEYGPENGEHIRNFLERSLKLDIQIGEKNADLYQKRPEGVMAFFEKNVVGFLQNPFFQNSRLGRTAGKVLGNPVLWAAVGGFATRGGLRAAGIIAATTAFAPATAFVIGAGVGAGLYLGFRAAAERRRDIQTGEVRAVLGQQETETHKLLKARDLIGAIQALDRKEGPLSDDDKKMVAAIQARLNVQGRYGVDLIGVEKAEGASLKSKLLAETDLRIALKKLLYNKKDQNGNEISGTGRIYDFGPENSIDHKKGLAEYERLIGDEEKILADQIEKVNAGVAKEIRRRAWKVGIVGGAMAAVGSAIAPYLAEKGLQGLDSLTGKHWASGKTQYIEEVANRISRKLGYRNLVGNYSGPMTGEMSLADFAGKAGIKLPKGMYIIDSIDSVTGQHYMQIMDHSAGKVLPGVRIPYEPGKGFAPNAFDELKRLGWNVDEHASTASGTAPAGGPHTPGTPPVPGHPGHPRTATEFLRDIKGKIPGGDVQPINTKNWYSNPFADNTTNLMVDSPNVGNELKFNISKDSLGNFHFKVPVEKDGSWLVNGKNWEELDLKKAFSDGRIKMLFMLRGSGEGIVMDVDPVTHEVIAPPGSDLSKILDPTTGRPTAEWDFGLAEKQGSGNDYIWINSDKGAGASAGYGTTGGTSGVPGVPGTPGGGAGGAEGALGGAGGGRSVFELRPPGAEGDMADPGFVAGYRREKNKDAERLRKKRMGKLYPEDKKSKAEADQGNSGHLNLAETHSGQIQETQTTPEADKEKLDLAFKAVKEKLDKNELTENELLKVCQEKGVNPEDLLVKCLEHKKVDQKPILEANKDLLARAPDLKYDLLWLALASSMEKGKAGGFKEGEKAATAEASNEAELDDGDLDDEQKAEATKILKNTLKPSGKPKGEGKDETKGEGKEQTGTEEEKEGEEQTGRGKGKGGKERESGRGKTRAGQEGRTPRPERIPRGEQFNLKEKVQEKFPNVDAWVAKSFWLEFLKKPDKRKEAILEKLTKALTEAQNRLSKKKMGKKRIMIVGKDETMHYNNRSGVYVIPENAKIKQIVDFLVPKTIESPAAEKIPSRGRAAKKKVA